jgi:hypothetical protein
MLWSLYYQKLNNLEYSVTPTIWNPTIRGNEDNPAQKLAVISEWASLKTKRRRLVAGSTKPWIENWMIPSRAQPAHYHLNLNILMQQYRNFFKFTMAWIEAETSNHCKLLMLLLHVGVFSEYADWPAQWGCAWHFKIITTSVIPVYHVLMVHFPLHILATVYNLYCEHLYPSHCSNGGGHMVAQLVEALRYKPEGCRFDSRCFLWHFS